jgi:dTDP-4-amino-4,6-dideoxygalactose transaminase
MAKNWEATINKLKATRSVNANKIASYGMMPAGALEGTMPDLIRYPVLATDKETKKTILRKSERMGLGISDGYPDSIDGIYEMQGLLGGNAFPVAKDIAERIVTLPVHPYVGEVDVKNIMQLFQERSYVEA